MNKKTEIYQLVYEAIEKAECEYGFSEEELKDILDEVYRDYIETMN